MKLSSIINQRVIDVECKIEKVGGQYIIIPDQVITEYETFEIDTVNDTPFIDAEIEQDHLKKMR